MTKRKRYIIEITALSVILCTMDGCSDYLFNRFAYLL